MIPITIHAIRRRRRGLLWWSLGFVASAGLIAIAYPTVRGNSSLNSTFAHLPPSVLAAFGLNPAMALTSPAGYLTSQFLANILPILLLVFGLGMAVWSVGGDERDGRLELLLANPVSRSRVALERVLALVLCLAWFCAASLATLLVLAPLTQLSKGLSAMDLAAACTATGALALCYASLGFAIGAATGQRSMALGATSAVAVAGFVVESLAAQVAVLRPLRDVTPWHWLLDGDPLRRGWAIDVFAPPLLASAVLVAIGVTLFTRRDLT